MTSQDSSSGSGELGADYSKIKFGNLLTNSDIYGNFI